MNQSLTPFLAILALTLCTLLLPACAHKTYKDDDTLLYRMKGYYNLGQYDQSIAEANKIQADSRHYKRAQAWITKAEAAKRIIKSEGYNRTSIGAQRDNRNWVIPTQK